MQLRSIGRKALLAAPESVRARVAPTAWRAYEHLKAARSPQGVADDGLPVPPPRLRIQVSRGGDPGAFLRSGREEADAIRALGEAHGASLASILDFGCGCGRVARYWRDLDGVHGCDYNGELVAWTAENLPFIRAEQNGALPPLPFHGFDFIYALSVFTHLTESAQFAWIEELHRALNPGGLLLFTTHGERFRGRMEPSERAAFDAGDLAVRFAEGEGSNLCGVYHPAPFLDRMLTEFERVADYTEGLPDVSSESPLHLQDVHLVRRPA